MRIAEFEVLNPRRRIKIVNLRNVNNKIYLNHKQSRYDSLKFEKSNIPLQSGGRFYYFFFSISSTLAYRESTVVISRVGQKRNAMRSLWTAWPWDVDYFSSESLKKVAKNTRGSACPDKMLSWYCRGENGTRPNLTINLMASRRKIACRLVFTWDITNNGQWTAVMSNRDVAV